MKKIEVAIAAIVLSLVSSYASATGCTTCGAHVVCEAEAVSGANWYQWLDFDTSLLTMDDPQGSIEMSFTCKKVDEGSVEVNAYTASPYANPPGQRVGSDQAYTTVCASCPTCGPAN